MSRFEKKKVIIYGGVFVVSFIGISLWSFWLVTHPPKYYSGLTPDNYDLPYEEVMLQTDDGVDIAAWIIPRSSAGTNNKKAIIFLHGYPAEKGDLLSIAKEFHGSFDILMFDFRSFGESGGGVTTIGKREQLDLKAAVDELEERGKTHIGLFGFSLGGATALLYTPMDERIKAVVTYAAFADLKQLGYETYRGLWVLKYPLVELLSLWAKVFLQYDIAQESPKFTATQIRVPVLILHSKNDDQISFRHAEILQESLTDNQNAEYYFFDNAVHGQLPVDYQNRVDSFFSAAFE